MLLQRKMLLRLFVCIAVLFCLIPVASAARFKFVVWGDSQFHHPETFEKIVRETELLKPALVLHVGDMIHGYTYDPDVARREWKRFKKQISPLTAPFYPTPGNHDVTTPEIEPIYGETWGKDRYFYSFDFEKNHFIILDVYYKGQFDTLPPEQLEWLKKDLEKNKEADNIFIAFHSPLHLNNKYDWPSVHKILRGYPVRAVFTGHSHIYDYRNLNGIDYFCLNSSGRMSFYNHLLGRSHHFLVVSVEGKEHSYAVVTQGSIYPADAVPSGSFGRASRYLMDEQTILIPNPSKRPIETTVEVPVKNRADEKRKFYLSWKTRDHRWQFDPCGADFELAPGDEKLISFKINGPQGNFYRDQLPRLILHSPFRNEKGWETMLSYHYQLFAPPETRAKSLDGGLKIDGKIEDLAWNKTPAITELYTDTKGTTTPEKNVVKVLYDKENLYVGIWGEEPNPAGMSAYAYGDIPLVFGDDDFEIYLDTNRDLKTYYRLMVNPKRVTLASGPEGLYSFDFMVKSHIGDSYWSAEFQIPFSELKTEPPKEGDVWGFNVRRHRQQAQNVQRDWSKMRNFPYQPPYFGLLRFD